MSMVTAALAIDAQIIQFQVMPEIAPEWPLKSWLEWTFVSSTDGPQGDGAAREGAGGDGLSTLTARRSTIDSK